MNLAKFYGFIKTLFDREQQCQWQFVKIASDPKPPANCAVKTILYLSCHMFRHNLVAYMPTMSRSSFIVIGDELFAWEIVDFTFFWLGFLNPGFLVLTLPQISSKGNNPVMWTIHNFFCVSLFDRDPLLQINPDCCSTLFCLTSVGRVGREVIIRIYKPNHHLLHTFFLFRLLLI